MVDEVILLDNVQFTKRDWRNRNMIKTPQGTMWLTIPVLVKGQYLQNIDETRISDARWSEKHWQTLRHAYSKAPCYSEMKDFVEWLYLHTKMEYLSEINYWFLTEISKWMKIETKFVSVKSLPVTEEDPTERLVALCCKVGATEYFTGPAAKSYLNGDAFTKANIQVTYLNYQDYPEYPQLYPPFDHAVTVLDLLFNTGQHFKKYMKSYTHEGVRN